MPYGGVFILPRGFRKADRRNKERTPEIKSLEDARRLVQSISARSVDNNPRVKAWRLAKQTVWLLLLVVIFLLYFLLDLAYKTFTLP